MNLFANALPKDACIQRVLCQNKNAVADVFSIGNR